MPKDVAYILPGFGCCSENGEYQAVAKMFRDRNIEAVKVPINWSRKQPHRFSDFFDDFFRHVKRQRSGRVYVLGFSFGATIAVLTAHKIRPDVLILCSLSPYFAEDQSLLPRDWLVTWHQRFHDSDFPFDRLASDFSFRTIVLVGEKEAHPCLSRAGDTFSKLADCRMMVIPEVGHDISEPGYLRTIETIVQTL